MSNLPSLIQGLITLVLAIVNAIPVIIQALVDAIPTIVSSIVDGLLSCLPQLIVGFIKLIAGVAKAVPQIFSSLREAMVNVFKGIWDGVTKVFAKVGTWFKEKFTEAKNKIKDAFGSVPEWFSGIWTKIKNTFSKVGKTIGDAVSGAFKKAINYVLDKAVKLINGFISAINFAIGVINKIPGVEISKLSLLDVPQMAKGGIVDSATLAVVGEQGKEAVVPLENNTEWLDKIANRLGADSSKPIYLMIDKKILGVASAEGINDITRQTGNIPLVIV
jgi:phage-related protein